MYAHNNTLLLMSLKCINDLSVVYNRWTWVWEKGKMCIDMNFNVHKEKGDNRRASYIYDLMGKKGRNDLESLTWSGKWYGVEVRQATYAKREYHSTITYIIVIDSSITNLLVFQCCHNPIQKAHLLADNCCPHHQWAEELWRIWWKEKGGSSIGISRDTR